MPTSTYILNLTSLETVISVELSQHGTPCRKIIKTENMSFQRPRKKSNNFAPRKSDCKLLKKNRVRGAIIGLNDSSLQFLRFWKTCDIAF